MTSLPAGNYSGGAGGNAGPSNATAATYGSGQDGSGWVVNFSGVQNASAAYDKSGGGVPGMTGSGAVFAQQLPQGVLLALAAAAVGVVLWRLKR